jgi:hypothetical protein
MQGFLFGHKARQQVPAKPDLAKAEAAVERLAAAAKKAI